jgi:hypothetical protein
MMLIENRTGKMTLMVLVVLLLIPLLVMLGMMVFGSGMIAQRGGMMGSGEMTPFILWSVLVAGVLVFPIVLLGRGSGLGVAIPFIQKRHRLRSAHVAGLQMIDSESGISNKFCDRPNQVAPAGNPVPDRREPMVPPPKKIGGIEYYR